LLSVDKVDFVITGWGVGAELFTLVCEANTPVVSTNAAAMMNFFMIFIVNILFSK